ncbi:MAG: hypothetical protein IJX70_01400 [Clostridia bacterium]|nr:hypothetical protein [Clostridia bacterium]
MAIGPDNGVIKRIKGVANNTKPNPEKLFVGEGIWMNQHIINEHTEVVCLVVCLAYIYTPRQRPPCALLRSVAVSGTW